MKKRQRKKLNKKLYKAIKELNEDLVDFIDFPEVDEAEILSAFNKIRKCPDKINSVFNDYYEFILKCR